jgi:hypothetical protein
VDSEQLINHPHNSLSLISKSACSHMIYKVFMKMGTTFEKLLTDTNGSGSRGTSFPRILKLLSKLLICLNTTIGSDVI